MRNENNRFGINLAASIIAFIVNAGIQFFVAPILTQSVGDEAYGFITIANDFAGYANIFTVILNSVAARFIGIEIHKGNNEKANSYFNSVIVGNFIICSVIGILGIIIVFIFPQFLNISEYLIPDVRIVFALTFIKYILSVLISIFTVSTFVKNRIDIGAVRNIISYLIQLFVILILFFNKSEVKVFYVSIAALSSTVFLGIANLGITKKIMPEVRFSPKRFKIAMVKELVKTGVWVSVNNLSNIFANNITASVINICLNAASVGFYSVSKTLSNCANTLLYTIYQLFTPTFVKLYAKNDIRALRDYSVKSMKIMSLCLMVPFIELCVYGTEFFALWQNFRSADEISNLGKLLLLAMLLLIIIVPVLPISQLGLVTNRIKWQTVNNLVVSIASIIGVYVVLKKTTLGLIGINIAILCIQGCKWLFFTPIYAAYVIREPKLFFFKKNILILLRTLLLGTILEGLSFFFSSCIHGWISLVCVVTVNTIIGYSLAILLYLNSYERKELFDRIKSFMLPVRYFEG